MKYYEMHEVVYQKLKSEKVLSWDQSTTFDQMWSHATNVFLQKFLTERAVSFSGLTTLDLGTGTGTSALFAASKGARAVGVEISPSAIEIAHENAKRLKLDVEFIVGDFLEINLERRFALVVDSTILHCLVGSSDRKKFYDRVKLHMGDDALFFVNTMIASGDMRHRFPKDHFLFQDDVLWSLGIKEVTNRKVIDGKSYFPHRTLLSEEKQLQEFSDNGFEVVQMERIVEEGEKSLVVLLKLPV